MAGATNKSLKKYGYSASQVRTIRSSEAVIAFKEMMAGPRLAAMRARRAEQAAKSQPTRREASKSPSEEAAKRQAPHQSVVDFSRDINHLAKHAKDGQWIGGKTFVHEVHKEYVRKHGDISEDAFKRRLVDAARAGKILLSRADLTQSSSDRGDRAGAYSKAALEKSRIHAGGEVYHFVEHGWL